MRTRRHQQSRRRVWISGASGESVDNAVTLFEQWRGSPVHIAGTWADATADDQLNLWKFGSGQSYESWPWSLDLAIGAIYKTNGESWSAAANGLYDARWSASLQNARSGWMARPRGTLYVRFSHEWNGDWFPWSVSSDEISDFVIAWQKFYQLQRAIFPEAKLVFCTNANTSGQDYDWRTAWPGDEYVDIYSTDYYSNHWMFNSDFDIHGAPSQLDTHRQFAADHHVPFAISEWGNDTNFGDQPNYIESIDLFCRRYGGTNAGELMYEVLFNVNSLDNNRFSIYPVTKAPLSSEVYRKRF